MEGGARVLAMVVALYDTRVTPGHEDLTTIIPFVGSITLYFTPNISRD